MSHEAKRLAVYAVLGLACVAFWAGVWAAVLALLGR